MWMIGVYIGIGITGILACIGIIVAGLIFFLWMRKRQEDSIKKFNGDLELQQLSLSVRTTSEKKISFEGSHYNFDDPFLDSTTPHKIPIENYSFEELQRATEDFSSSNLIEGSVFLGRLKGKNFAIKKTKNDILSKIDYFLFQERVHRHPNIIRFMGTCISSADGINSFLVFEFAKNGSLKDWIHHKGLAIKSQFIASCNCFLTWSQRLKICLDIATALQYMHHIINPSYVHKNIRSRNIFLDEEFNAKIGNFGMARCVGPEAEEDQDCSCIQASWNRGYLAPEYNNSSLICTSVDVFAFGVVLLEVLSGKPPVKRGDDERGGGEFMKLSDEIKNILKSEDAEGLREWMDGALGDNYSFDAAVAVANLARSCVEDDPSLRPNAGEIVEKLLRLVEELPDGDQLNICESSCKPLVFAVARER